MIRILAKLVEVMERVSDRLSAPCHGCGRRAHEEDLYRLDWCSNCRRMTKDPR